MRLTDTRQAILEIADRKNQVDLYYLQKNLSKRKTITEDVYYSNVLEDIEWLEKRKLLKYIGHSCWSIDEKGKYVLNQD